MTTKSRFSRPGIFSGSIDCEPHWSSSAELGIVGALLCLEGGGVRGSISAKAGVGQQ